MKKKYTTPELEMVLFRLDSQVLLSSIERGQKDTAGGDMPDPIGDDPIISGGLW